MTSMSSSRDVEQPERRGHRDRHRFAHVAMAVMLLAEPVAQERAAIGGARHAEPSQEGLVRQTLDGEREHRVGTGGVACTIDPFGRHFDGERHRPGDDPPTDRRGHQAGDDGGIARLDATQP